MVAFVIKKPLHLRKPESLYEWNILLQDQAESARRMFSRYNRLCKLAAPLTLRQYCVKVFKQRERRFWRLHKRFLAQQQIDLEIRQGLNN